MHTRQVKKWLKNLLNLISFITTQKSVDNRIWKWNIKDVINRNIFIGDLLLVTSLTYLKVIQSLDTKLMEFQAAF